MYTPDNWVIIKTKDTYKVLAGWSGGYLTPDNWKINSGIVSVTEDKDNYYFVGHSKSIYRCRKHSYCLRKHTIDVWESIKYRAELLPENTDWVNFEWTNE